jgi:hypothetical protein
MNVPGQTAAKSQKKKRRQGQFPATDWLPVLSDLKMLSIAELSRQLRA